MSVVFDFNDSLNDFAPASPISFPVGYCFKSMIKTVSNQKGDCLMPDLSARDLDMERC